MRVATARVELPAHPGAQTAVRAKQSSTTRLVSLTGGPHGRNTPRYAPSGTRAAGIAAAIAAHAALLAVLWQFAPVRGAVEKHVPVLVQVITPPRVVTPPAEPPKPARQPAPKAAPRPAPPPVAPLPQARPPSTLAALPQAPAIAEMVPLPTAPAVDAPAIAPPVAAITPAAAPAPAPVVAAPPAQPLMPPRFDAEYLRNPPPEYPALSRKRGEEGRVLLRVHVTSEGSPREIEIRTSSGFERLDRAAVETVKRWKFVPARQGDTAVDASVLVPIVFALSH